MEFDQLRTLLAVLEHGGFTRAAEALGLSQSTVSFHIKSLEKSLGTRLLDRGRDGVRATVHGTTLARYAGRMLDLRVEAASSLGALDTGVVGRIDVAASTIPGEYLLPEVLARLRRTHPGVSVSVHVGDTSRAVGALREGIVDLAITGSPSGDRKIEETPCAQDTVVLVGPQPPPAGFDGLIGVPLVLRREGSGTRAAVADVLARALDGGSPGPTVEVGSTEAAKRCVLAGLGLAFISQRAVERELAAGILSVHPLLGLPAARTFYLATVRGVTLSPAAAALRELLICA
ncbi:MAG: LysR family transcriptional regulator [Nannocystaceae bacterium]|nr:LysR family transcriptional regulator [Nannocystaceae bacterium]